MKTMGHNGYYTLITGASSGIGKAFAEERAGQGNNLFLVSLPDTGLRELAEELSKKHGIKAEYLCLDLRKSDSPEKVKEFTLEKSLPVDFLINNAGIGYDGSIENHTRKEIDEMISLNIHVLTNLTRLFIPELKKRERSYILNVSSFGAFMPSAYKSVYLASKSYVYYFSEALRSELNDGPVRVSTLMPSGVLTNGEVKERIRRAGFLGRASALTPGEVAGYTLRKMESRSGVIIPGKISRSFLLTFGLLPSFLVMNLMKKVFREKEG
jgi:uncharacterized protein